MATPGFVGLVIAIARLNKAMREAAENPMDEWRRQNVKHAMGMMPGAIRVLAADFKSGKLHDADLPIVQAMLGGFIDVNAPDGYKKFLANPDKRLIPKVGKSLPVDLDQAAGGTPSNGGLIFNDNVAKGNNGQMQYTGEANGAPGSLPKADSSELLNLAELPSGSVAAPKRNNAALTFDEGVQKQGATESAPYEGQLRQPASAGVAAAPSNTNSFQESVSDLRSIEAAFAGSVQSAPIKKQESLDKEFFETEKKAENKASKREGKRGRRSELKTNPKYWNAAVALRLAESIWLPTAQAADCQECSGGKGGGGGKAADILFGLAAIMAAVAPMVAAGIQAGADKDIARTNAAAQIRMTQISADTSRRLADQQRDIALAQADKQAEINRENQQAVSERLTMQLNELNKARSDAQKFEEKKQDYAQKLDQQRIDLAKMQFEQTQKLANMQMRAQLAALGLSQGITSTVNSGSTLTRSGGSIPTGGALTGGTGNTALGVANSVQGRPSNVAMGAVGGTAAKTDAANRLLSNLSGNVRSWAGVGTPAQTNRAATSSSRLRRSATASVQGSVAGGNIVNPEAPSTGRSLQAVMETNSAARGTMAQPSQAAPKVSVQESETALSRLLANSKVQNNSGFAGYVAEEARRYAAQPVAVIAVPTTSGHSPSGVRGAYNAPDLGAEQSVISIRKTSGGF